MGEIGNLRMEVHRLKNLLKPLIHLKHLFLFWKQTYIDGDQMETSKDLLNDLNLCLTNYAKEIASWKGFAFIQQQEELYGSHSDYCDYRFVINQTENSGEFNHLNNDLNGYANAKKTNTPKSKRKKIEPKKQKSKAFKEVIEADFNQIIENSQPEINGRPKRQSVTKRKLVIETDDSDSDESSFDLETSDESSSSEDEDFEEEIIMKKPRKAIRKTKKSVTSKVSILFWLQADVFLLYSQQNLQLVKIQNNSRKMLLEKEKEKMLSM